MLAYWFAIQLSALKTKFLKAGKWSKRVLRHQWLKLISLAKKYLEKKAQMKQKRSGKKLLPKWRLQAIVVIIIVSIAVITLGEKTDTSNWIQVGKVATIVVTASITLFFLIQILKRKSVQSKPTSTTETPPRQTHAKAGKPWGGTLVLVGVIVGLVLIVLYGNKLQIQKVISPTGPVPQRGVSAREVSSPEKFTKSPWEQFPGPDRDSLFILVSDTTLRNIAACESDNMQYEDSTRTAVLRGRDPDDVGIFQINNRLWADTAKAYEVNLHTLKGNSAFAQFLIEKRRKEGKTGYEDWQKSAWCWQDHYTAKPLGYGYPKAYLTDNYERDSLIVVDAQWSDSVAIPPGWNMWWIGLDSASFWVRNRGDSLRYSPKQDVIIGRPWAWVHFKADADTVIRIRVCLSRRGFLELKAHCNNGKQA